MKKKTLGGGIHDRCLLHTPHLPFNRVTAPKLKHLSGFNRPVVMQQGLHERRMRCCSLTTSEMQATVGCIWYAEW